MPTPRPVPLNMAEAEAFAEDERGEREPDDEGRASLQRHLDERFAKGGLGGPYRTPGRAPEPDPDMPTHPNQPGGRS